MSVWTAGRGASCQAVLFYHIRRMLKGMVAVKSLLSKDALTVLGWFRINAIDWLDESEIQESCPLATRQMLSYLSDERLIDRAYNEEDPIYSGFDTVSYPASYRVSQSGIGWLEYEEQRRRDRRNGWIRYIITTAIAAAALVKAFLPEIVAIAVQIGMR